MLPIATTISISNWNPLLIFQHNGTLQPPNIVVKKWYTLLDDTEIYFFKLDHHIPMILQFAL